MRPVVMALLIVAISMTFAAAMVLTILWVVGVIPHWH
jgi:hypothetical protein